MRKLFLLILFFSMVSANGTDFLHPTNYILLPGTDNKMGTTPANAIDNGIGDRSTWWKFSSVYWGGADFWLQWDNTTVMQNITIQTESTGHKDIVVERSDGGYDIVYSIGPSSDNVHSEGSKTGNYIQSDGKIIIGVRNTGPVYDHYLSDISFKFNYLPANSPPSVPFLLSPSFNQTFDSSVFFSWNASSDADNDALTYFLEYSNDSGLSWHEIASNRPCCSYGWDTLNKTAGVYLVGVKAFDGQNYSSRNQTTININHVFFGQKQQNQNAVLGAPVEWGVLAYGSGNQNCNYTLPTDYLSAKAFNSSGGQQNSTNGPDFIAFSCNFATGNYTINFTTPAVVLNEYGWTQDNAKQTSITKQYIREVQGVKNPSSSNYSNVSGNYACYSGFSCSPTSFAYALLAAGAENNATIEADGDKVSQDETIDIGDYYNKTLSLNNTLFALQNVSAQFSIPTGLVFKLLLFNGSGFAYANESAYSFTTENGTATLVFPDLAYGTTQLRLSAKRKLAGEACASSLECASGSCIEGVCIGSSEESLQGGNALATPTPSAQPNATVNATPSPQGKVEAIVLEQVDIRVPAEVEVGSRDIGVFVNGNPASGFVKITDPNGNSFYREIQNGVASFFFDKTGRWRVGFRNETKEITVVKTSKPSPTTAVLGGQPSKITGLAIGEINPVLGALILLLLLATALWYQFFYKTVRVSRKVYDGNVEIKIRNNLADLKNVRVLQLVPEGSTSHYSKKPSVKETVTGDLLEWRFSTIKKGNEVVLTHDFSGQSLAKPVEVKAETSEGKGVSFWS